MKQVVLVGGGHAHLHVVSAAEEFKNAGIELSLIDPGKLWYSGMATGMLGGMYTADEDSIDLAALCGRYKVNFINSKAVGLDTSANSVELETGQQLHYDLLSLNVGSKTNTTFIEDPENVAWTVKPIPKLLELKSTVLRHRTEPLRVGVIGGGPTGCEIAANIEVLSREANQNCEIIIYHSEDCLVPEYPAGAASALSKHLKKRGIEIRTGMQVAAIGKKGSKKTLSIKNGGAEEFDEVVIATGLLPSDSIEQLGLGENGLEVDSTLAALKHPGIFGAGDCILFRERDLPKIGVFGVRQAPILKDNLIAAANGRPLRKYEPQEKFLAILNLGNGEGLAVRGDFYWLGRLSFLLKNFIDKRFMRKYQDW